MIRRHVVVSGRVQGVWFRDGCRQAAEAAGVSGWVRNRADGTVEAVFEGSDEDVNAMLDWARDGTPRAVVADLTITDEDTQGESGFRIR